jgi:hypothetical protein
MKSRIVLLLFLCWSLVTPAAAQTVTKPDSAASQSSPKSQSPKGSDPVTRSEKGERTKKPGQQGSGDPVLDYEQGMALDSLRALSSLVKDIEDEVVAIRIQAQIADALWDRDQVEARKLFEKAFKQVGSLKKTSDVADYPQALTGLSQRFQLRSDILRMISSRDAAWAEELIKSAGQDQVTQRENEENSARAAATANRANLAATYVRTASFFIDKDLQRSIQLTKASLNYGISQELLAVLYAIRLRDRAAADGLVLEALSSVKRDPIPSTRFINSLGPYVFSGFGQGSGPVKNDKPPAEMLRINIVEPFLELSYEVINSQTPSLLSTLTFEEAVLNYMTIRAMIPYFDAYMPDKAPAMRLALARRDSRLPKEDIDAVDLFTDSEDFNELASRADSVKNVDLKDSMYAKAALKALGGDEVDRALSIVEKIDDSDMKKGVQTIIRFTAATRAIQKNDPDAAYKQAEAIPSTSHQVFALSTIADALGKRDPERAKQILAEAAKTIDSKLEGVDRVRGWLAITKTMCRIDEVAGLDYLQSAVKALNTTKVTLSMLNTAPAPDGIKFVDLVNMNLGYDKINLQDGFAILADKDYQGSWGVARSIADKEASIAAQLAVFRTVLKRKPHIPETPAALVKPEPTGREATDIREIAKFFVSLLAEKQFEIAITRTDENLQNSLAGDKLREHWTQLTDQHGPFVKQLGVTKTKQKYEIVTVECEFGSSHVFIRIAFNEQKQINGLFFSADAN